MEVPAISEGLQFLLSIAAAGLVCGLWAWLQILNAPEGCAEEPEAACGLDRCEICRGLGRGKTCNPDPP